MVKVIKRLNLLQTITLIALIIVYILCNFNIKGMTDLFWIVLALNMLGFLLFTTKWSKEGKTLYRKMDIIISPTRHNVLSEGSFDGFPTGATTEAMINGVVAITTDFFNGVIVTFIKYLFYIIIHNSSYNQTTSQSSSYNS